MGLIVLVGLVALLYALRSVATPVLAAAGGAYVLMPVIHALKRRGVPRTLSVVMLMTGVIVLSLGVFAVVLPILIAQSGALARNLPGYAAEVLTYLRTHFGDLLPMDDAATFEQFKASVKEAGPSLLRAAGQVFERGRNAIGTLVSVFVVPLFMFFFLKDAEQIVGPLYGLLPEPMQPPLRKKLAQIDRTISAYLRGVLTVASVLAIIYSVGLTLLGVPLGLIVGVLAGYAYIIPFMSTVVGVGLGVLLCLLEFTGWGQVVGVVLLFVAGNAIEGLFLTPRIVGESLGLHPLAVILAVMIGANLFGFLGVLLALPTAAVLNVVGKDLVALWRTSDVYATGLRPDKP